MLKLWNQETLKTLIIYTCVIFHSLSPSIFHTFINTVSLQWQLHIHENIGINWHCGSKAFLFTGFLLSFECLTYTHAHLLNILSLAVKTIAFIQIHLSLLHPFLGHPTENISKVIQKHLRSSLQLMVCDIWKTADNLFHVTIARAAPWYVAQCSEN